MAITDIALMHVSAMYQRNPMCSYHLMYLQRIIASMKSEMVQIFLLEDYAAER